MDLRLNAYDFLGIFFPGLTQQAYLPKSKKHIFMESKGPLSKSHGFFQNIFKRTNWTKSKKNIKSFLKSNTNISDKNLGSFFDS